MGPGMLLDRSRPLLAHLGRSKIVLGAVWGIPLPSRQRPGASPKKLGAPKTGHDRIFVDFSLMLVDFSSIVDRLFVDFRTTFALCLLLLLCSLGDRNRLKKRRKKKKTRRCRGRLAFGRSSLPARLSRSTPQLATQRFTRSIKQSPPSLN